jgi:hypothetical protein
MFEVVAADKLKYVIGSTALGDVESCSDYVA